MKPPPGSDWWEGWVRLAPNLGAHLERAAPDDVAVSPLVPDELHRQLGSWARRHQVRLTTLLTRGGRTLWEPAGLVVWAQPNRIGLLEQLPHLPPERQLVAVDPAAAPLVTSHRAPVWSRAGILRRQSHSGAVVQKAARRMGNAVGWLEGSVRSVGGCHPLGGFAGRLALLTTTPPARVARRVEQAGFPADDPPVPGLPGLVVIEVGWWQRKPDLERLVDALAGKDLPADEGRVPTRVPDDLPDRPQPATVIA